SRHAVPLGDLVLDAATKGDRGGVYLAAGEGEDFPRADRDRSVSARRILRGRGVSSGLRDAAPLAAVHRDQRCAEGGQSQKAVPAALPRKAGAGRTGPAIEIRST